MEDKKSVVTSEGNTFVSSECAIKKVTVYSDRAEVCRLVETETKRGVNEIVLKQLPSCIDPDSIRVEGKGPATIAEVSYQRKFLPRDEAETSQKEKELEADIETVKKQKSELEAKLVVISKQMEVLHNFADTVSNVGASGKAPAPVLDSGFFKGIGEFVKLIGEQGDRLQSTRLDVEHQLTVVADKITAGYQNLIELKGSGSRQQESRECTIVLECEDSAKILLSISYVVTRASWIPSYDIRMFTTEGTMKIFYYGQIKQSSGEDWKDAKLFLSTASPSIGGVVPELAVQVLSIKYRSVNRYQGRGVVQKKKSKGFAMPSFSLSKEDYAECELCDASESLASDVDVELAVTQVNESTTSTTYEIARLSTIPSDNVEHKVSVGILDVKPKLEYITLPKTVPHAFLQARVTNTSQFTLLPGATSIFLDNSFVAKATVKAVSPGEEFECSLGVDPGVRVTYKPLKKFRGSSGIFSKTVCTTYHQVTEVKNSHDYQIKIEVRDQLPRSSDDKIKVNLLEPVVDMKHPEKNTQIHLTKHNHVVWEVNLDKQEVKEVSLKYTIEYPASEEISSSEVFES